MKLMYEDESGNVSETTKELKLEVTEAEEDLAAAVPTEEETGTGFPVIPVLIAAVILAGVVTGILLIRRKRAIQWMQRRRCWMNWKDLLRMSLSNLKRRRLRTFLTVLGVLIGTASIVVMISLGLGLQQSLYREVEQSGGLTMIRVSGADAGSSMMYSEASEEVEKIYRR